MLGKIFERDRSLLQNPIGFARGFAVSRPTGSKRAFLSGCSCKTEVLQEPHRSLIYRWIKEAGPSLDKPIVDGEIKEIEFDEMWHFIGSKNKIWLIKAVDRSARKTIAWVLGARDVATFRLLYDKIKRLENCKFYTDDWDAFAKVLPKKRHYEAQLRADVSKDPRLRPYRFQSLAPCSKPKSMLK